jgi:hypothetical protein
VVPAMVNVRWLPFVIPDSMSRNGEESDEQTHAYQGRLPLEVRTLVDVTAIDAMPTL